MRFLTRKTAPKVRDGRVQRKNRWGRTPPRDAPLIIPETAPRGWRHLLTVGDVEAFIELLPAELMEGVEHIVLSEDVSCLGWYRRGVVALAPWQRELYAHWPMSWVHEHWDSLQRYAVPVTLHEGFAFCDFNEAQVRAFQLLRIFTHELGHHADRMTTRSKRCARGEPFAEKFARQWDQQLWADYVDRFGAP